MKTTNSKSPLISSHDFIGLITKFDRDRLTAYTQIKGITWMDAIDQIIADPAGMHKTIDSIVPANLQFSKRPKHTDFQIKYSM